MLYKSKFSDYLFLALSLFWIVITIDGYKDDNNIYRQILNISLSFGFFITPIFQWGYYLLFDKHSLTYLEHKTGKTKKINWNKITTIDEVNEKEIAIQTKTDSVIIDLTSKEKLEEVNKHISTHMPDFHG